MLGNPTLQPLAPILLYRTMPLPDDRREAAVLFALCARLAMQQPASLARAGYRGTPLEMAAALFDAILAGPSGVVFAVDAWADQRARIATPDQKIQLALPDLLEELARMPASPPEVRDPAFPFVLSAG